MKNFDWTIFTRRIAIKAGISTLYNAWTTQSEIEKWFLSKANFIDANGRKIESTTPIESGYTYEWSWHLYDIVERGRIIEANGKDHIQFTFAGECIVDVIIKEQGEHVIVELTQREIPTDEDSMKNIRLGCDTGWSFFLVNMKSFYEAGHDLRNKNTALTGMLNN